MQGWPSPQRGSDPRPGATRRPCRPWVYVSHQAGISRAPATLQPQPPVRDGPYTLKGFLSAGLGRQWGPLRSVRGRLVRNGP